MVFFPAEISKHQKALPPISDFLTKNQDLLESAEPFALQYSALLEEDFTVLFQPWDTPLFLQKDEFQRLLIDVGGEEANKKNDKKNDETPIDTVQSETEKRNLKKKTSQTCKLPKTLAANVAIVEKDVKTVQRTAAKKCFSCEDCKQTFATKYTLLVHRHLEHLGFSFVCPVDPGACHKEFKSKNGLRYHVEREHFKEKAAFVAGKFGELVAKTYEADGSYIPEGPTYFIKKDEVGSPRLVKCKNKRKGCNSSSSSSSSQDESSGQSDAINASKIRSQKSSQQSDIVGLQTRARCVSVENGKGEPKGKKTGFEARYQQMYNEFSPALKKTANQFNFMKDVVEKEKKVQATQADVLSKCSTGAKKKTEFQ